MYSLRKFLLLIYMKVQLFISIPFVELLFTLYQAKQGERRDT